MCKALYVGLADLLPLLALVPGFAGCLVVPGCLLPRALQLNYVHDAKNPLRFIFFRNGYDLHILGILDGITLEYCHLT